MQQLKITAVFALALGLAACGTNQRPVPVIKATQDSTILRTNQPAQPTIPDLTPPGVTAICQDGSYSQATDSSTCVGNGGVRTFVGRYRSE